MSAQGLCTQKSPGQAMLSAGWESDSPACRPGWARRYMPVPRGPSRPAGPTGDGKHHQVNDVVAGDGPCVSSGPPRGSRPDRSQPVRDGGQTCEEKGSGAGGGVGNPETAMEGGVGRKVRLSERFGSASARGVLGCRSLVREVLLLAGMSLPHRGCCANPGLEAARGPWAGVWGQRAAARPAPAPLLQQDA